MDKKQNLALRLDDVGACSKRYEVYSSWSFGLGNLRLSGNWLFLKYLPPWKRWGPYRELRANEWEMIFQLLEVFRAKLTVAVTAAWADAQDRLIPFPRKFPEAASALKRGVRRGLIEIANHGLTHCVLQDNRFKPKWFSGNRRFHREFLDEVPLDIQEEHIRHSQQVLQDWLEAEVVTFVPPGNAFIEPTLQIASRHGLRFVSCYTPRRLLDSVTIIGDEQVLPFHDRDIVLHGMEWFRALLVREQQNDFCFVRELGEHLISTTTSEVKVPV
ncbi:MAG: polysaccharide deacetylase family protein [Candidatus Omnitrophica bacterium]|nr:polysaccharide deacetylase family protein [Candidatus Omnitrophota bacterium]